MMTSKEIFLKALRFEDTPRLPVGVLDGYAWMLNQTGKSFEDFFNDPASVQLVVEQYGKLGTDIVYSNGHVFNMVHKVMGGEIHCDKVGDAVEIRKSPLSEIGDYKNYNVDEVMEKAFATPEYVSVLGQAKELYRLVGDEKLVSTLAYAPFTVAAMLVGVQEFMATLVEDEDETIALIDFATDLVIKSAEKFLDCGAEAVFMADPVASGDLISPALYEMLVMASIQKVCKHFNARNVPVLCHICGHTEKRLEPLLESGLAAFSMDSVDLKTALGIARGHYAILGNFSPFDVLMSKNADEVRAICDAHAKVAGHGGGYILFPGCDLAPKTPLENVQAMVAAAHNAFA